MGARAAGQRLRRVGIAAALLFASTAVGGERPERWAQPVSAPGVPNLHRVTPYFYRGGQPDSTGFAFLCSLGVKTVVNLRWLHDDRDKIGSLPLRYERVRMVSFFPSQEDVRRVLAIIVDRADQPVFVHCQHGADRTGAVCAAFRMVVEGWSLEEALDEMRNGGYGYHRIHRELIALLRSLDAAAVRRELGLPDP